MIWVIQADVPKHSNRDAMVAALTARGERFLMVNAMDDDWSLALDEQLSARDDVVVYGSTRLARHAAVNWRPGAFLGESFTFHSCLAGWGDRMLNAAATVVRFEDLDFDGPMFVRPVQDSKLFGGEMIDGSRLRFWKELRLSENKRLSADTEVVVAPLRRIEDETRCFVVSGKVVASSRYVSQGMLDIGTAAADTLAFAQESADAWRPHDNFVLDIARTQGGHKVIEVNCLNSSGLYACDATAVVDAMAHYLALGRQRPLPSMVSR